jgi:glutamate---cysteine ligase / carboxylate-amine ligase
MSNLFAHPEAISIGIEEEYQIIDPVTRELSSDAELLLQEASQVLGKNVQPEIQQSQLEVATEVCYTLEQARNELRRLRHGVIVAAEHCQRQVVAAGTHPFSHWNKQALTSRERYWELGQDYQQLACEQSIFGCHVHVGMSDRETALQVMNHARLWLSPLLALAANSPFWRGIDTGYASFRTMQWARWPQSGPPQYFSSLAEYEALTSALQMTGVLVDLTRIYWDMRLSERYPTIELRLMDVCTSIDDTIMIAGLVRALISTCYECVQHKQFAPPIRQELLRMAHWQAARYGLNGTLIDVYSICSLPASHMIERFLYFVRPALEMYGDWEEISSLVHATMSRGSGADRQRVVYQHTGSLEEVVSYLIAETARETADFEQRKTA